MTLEVTLLAETGYLVLIKLCKVNHKSPVNEAVASANAAEKEVLHGMVEKMAIVEGDAEGEPKEKSQDCVLDYSITATN
jgi:hypothetical protein